MVLPYLPKQAYDRKNRAATTKLSSQQLKDIMSTYRKSAVEPLAEEAKPETDATNCDANTDHPAEGEGADPTNSSNNPSN